MRIARRMALGDSLKLAPKLSGRIRASNAICAANWGASQVFWSGSRGAAIPPIDDFGPAVVFEAAFDGEQGVGARFRPAAPRLFEPVSDDALAGAFTMPDPTCNQRAR